MHLSFTCEPSGYTTLLVEITVYIVIQSNMYNFTKLSRTCMCVCTYVRMHILTVAKLLKNIHQFTVFSRCFEDMPCFKSISKNPGFLKYRTLNFLQVIQKKKCGTLSIDTTCTFESGIICCFENINRFFWLI